MNGTTTDHRGPRWRPPRRQDDQASRSWFL